MSRRQRSIAVDLRSRLLSDNHRAGSRAITRISVAEALGKLGEPRAEPALLQLLTSDAEPVRRAAAVALGDVIRNRDALTRLPRTGTSRRAWEQE